MRKTPVITLLVALLIFGFYFISTHSSKPASNPSPTPTNQSANATPASNQVLGARTKTEGCQAQGALPDKACTPGATFPNVTKDDVCTPGYSQKVRNVPPSIKDIVFSEYGIASHQPGQYEVDHFISLELGGSNEIANLWPESADPRPGYHEKDKAENYLHQQVCNGSISLQQAQQMISNNWIDVYHHID